MDFPTFRLLAFERPTGAQRAEIAQQLDLICGDTGFLLLEYHGIAEHIIAAQWETITAFFASSASEKQKVAAPYAGYPYG